MIIRTSRYLVALTLVVMALGGVFFAGCSRDEEAKPQADPPSVYMKDAVFTNALATQRAARGAILRARTKLVAEMEARVDAMREKLKGASDEAVKKELEKDPAWNSLVKRVTDLNTAFEDNRKETTGIVAERLKPRAK